MDDIEALPTMLMGAIRRGAWISPEAYRLRETARTIIQGQQAGIDMTDMTVVLAGVTLAEVASVTIRTNEVARIEELVRPAITDQLSVLAVETAYGPCRTVAQVHDAAKRYVADRYEQVEPATARRAA